WNLPTVEGDTAIVRATLPPGMPVTGIVLTVRTADGEISEIIQEVILPDKPPPTSLALEPAIAGAIDNAFANGTPIVLSYVDGAGAPHTSFRGTVQSHGPEQLALWARDPHGGLVRALQTNPNVALLYRDPASRTQYEFAGRASITDDPVERDRIFE